MQNNPPQRPTRADIDLDNLAFNFHSVKNFVGDGLKYMAVVKADAYGHGSVPCAKRLEAEGVDWFGVALPEEGVELRRAGITKLILSLGGFWPGQEHILFSHRLTPVIFQIENARRLNEAAEQRGSVINIHVKIDTGMGRIGVPAGSVESFVREMLQFKHLRVEGLMTHFAAADCPEEVDFTNGQISAFEKACRIFKEAGINPSYFDMANSPASIAYPRSHGNMVRLGGVLYGLGRDVLPSGIDKPELRPVMSLYSKIAYLKHVPAGETLGYGRTFETRRESLIATVPIGYQDGYRRSLSNNGTVIVRGRPAPIVGRISMDWTIVDVTEIDSVAEGDEVILIGRSGESAILAEDLAAASDTISYEITCSIDRRVPRRYLPE